MYNCILNLQVKEIYFAYVNIEVFALFPKLPHLINVHTFSMLQEGARKWEARPL